MPVISEPTLSLPSPSVAISSAPSGSLGRPGSIANSSTASGRDIWDSTATADRSILRQLLPAYQRSALQKWVPRREVLMNAGLYATMGFSGAAFNVCTPDIKERLQATDWALSTVFLASSIGSAATLFRVSSALHSKLGPRLCTAASTASAGTALALVGWTTFWPLTAAVQMGSGASIGVMGVSIGCTSMVLDKQSAVMGSTEAMYSLGTLMGALCTEALLSAGVPMPATLTGVGATVIVMAALSYVLTAPEGTVRPTVRRQKAEPAIVWLSLGGVPKSISWPNRPQIWLK